MALNHNETEPAVLEVVRDERIRRPAAEVAAAGPYRAAMAARPSPASLTAGGALVHIPAGLGTCV